jgi:hypothetical protein
MSITIDGSDKPATRTSLGLSIGTDVLAPNGSAANLTAIPAANISGVIPPANLGTGTANSSTFLNGAGAYATAGGGAWTKVSSGSVNNGNLVVNNVTGNIRIVFANTDNSVAGAGNNWHINSSTDNGSTFESGSNTYQMTTVSTSAFHNTQTISTFASTAISGVLTGWTYIDICNPTNSNTRTTFSCTSTSVFASVNTQAANTHQLTYGLRDALEDNDAFKITLQGNATGITCNFVVMALS